MSAQSVQTEVVLPSGWLRALVRHRLSVSCVIYLMSAVLFASSETDLHYSLEGARLILRGGAHGGLHVYAARPDIQIGPLALLLSGGLNVVSAHHLATATVVLAGALFIAFQRLLADLVRGQDATARHELNLFLGGLALAPAWALVVPYWAHLEDLLALVLVLAALLAIVRRRPVLAAGMLVLAVGCKPWAVYALGCVAFLPRRQAVRAALVAVVGTAVVWSPFLASAGTLHALDHFSLVATYGSLPKVLGYRHAPGWVRPGQLVLSTALIAVAARRQRWDLALLIVAVSRIVLDAGDFTYYDVELVVGCVVADALATPTGRVRARGALGLVLMLVWDLAPLSSSCTFELRAITCVGLLGWCWATPSRTVATAPGTLDTDRRLAAWSARPPLVPAPRPSRPPASAIVMVKLIRAERGRTRHVVAELSTAVGRAPEAAESLPG